MAWAVDPPPPRLRGARSLHWRQPDAPPLPLSLSEAICLGWRLSWVKTLAKLGLVVLNIKKTSFPTPSPRFYLLQKIEANIKKHGR